MNDKVAALADIYYEASELHLLYDQYFSVRKPHPDSLLNNAVVEKALIHVRNLMDFFERVRDQKLYPGSKFLKAMPDDIICEDYGYAPRLIVVDVDLRDRINKRVAHLSYKRTTLPRVYYMEMIVPILLVQSREFFAKLLQQGHELPTFPPKESFPRLVYLFQKYGN